jgi:hypothetical protein
VAKKIAVGVKNVSIVIVYRQTFNSDRESMHSVSKRLQKYTTKERPLRGRSPVSSILYHLHFISYSSTTNTPSYSLQSH